MERTRYYIIRGEYERIMEIIIKMERIINMNEKILLYNSIENKQILNEIIKNMNEIYNDNIINYEDNKIGEYKNEYNKYMEKSKINKILKIEKSINFNPYMEIKKKILLLSKIVGLTSINDLLYLEMDYDIELIEDEENRIELMNKILNVVDYEIKTIKERRRINKEIRIISKIVRNSLIMDNGCEVEIEIEMNREIKNIKITGYIENLSVMNIINITKSNRYIKKKLEEINIIRELYEYEKDELRFVDKYIKNMKMVEIVSLNKQEIIKKINMEYSRLKELENMGITKLIKTYTRSNNNEDSIMNMYNMIRILLLGEGNSNLLGGLLYNLLKDKKNNMELITDIIYNNMTLDNQKKIKKSIINMEKMKNMTSITINDVDLKKKIILTKNLPENARKICLERLEELKNNNNETHKIKTYINTLLDFPWLSDEDDNIFKNLSNNNINSINFLNEMEEKLNKEIYGHKEAKTKVIQMLGKLISVQNNNIHPIALSGPPGVGKTKFAQILAECLKIPFIQITLGGQNDGELLHGHGYTYSGAQPGLIIKKMVEVGTARCIMYFDELDKCVSRSGGGVNEVMSILIHLTDPMTNNKFQDRFFQEITFPLNKVIFMFSFNDIEKIDKILLDRMEVINVNSYSINDKINISKNYLLKNLYREVNFKEEDIIFTDEMIKKIIEEYTYEPGVRKLKRNLENILLNLNIDRIYKRKSFERENKIIIDDNIIRDSLGETRIEFKKIHNENTIGLVNGLYASSLGIGGIVPIQITKNSNNNKNFVLRFTGNHKKIMKESIICGFTSAINLITEDEKEEFFDKYKNGLHIHTPDNSTPKDGPSAGSAFCVGFMSLMIKKKIRRDVGITGEIDLYGNMMKIGGIRYKIIGGFKAGLNKIILPEENREEYLLLLKDMPELKNENKEILFANKITDIFNVIFD